MAARRAGGPDRDRAGRFVFARQLRGGRRDAIRSSRAQRPGEAIDQCLGGGAPGIPFGFGAAAGLTVGAGAAVLGHERDVIDAGGRQEGIVGAGPVLHGNVPGLFPDKGGEQLVEPGRATGGRQIGGAAPIEPGKMGEQQAAVMAAAGADHLAAMEHRFLHPIERAFGQHGLGMIAGKDQGGIPAGGEMGRAAAADIGRLGRDAGGRAGGADRARSGKAVEEPGLAFGGETVVTGFRRGRGFAQRRRGSRGRRGGKPLPVRGGGGAGIPPPRP